MMSLPRHSWFLAICLSALAGYVDAVGFIHLGGYFVSFMSGNTTRLSVALEGGDWVAAELLALILCSFIAGAALGSVIGHYAADRRRLFVLLSVAVLLAAAAFSAGMGAGFIAVACLVLAMGAENAVFQKDGQVTLGLTYMTGTLVKIGQKIAQAMLGGSKTEWVPYTLLWLGLMSGGILGAFSYTFFGFAAIWLAAVAALVLAALPVSNRA